MSQIGKPVSGKNFIGREKEIAQLMAYLEMGQNVVLIAPRRFGKTSLVMEAIKRFQKENYYTALVDIFTKPTLPLLSSAITGEVLKNHKLHKHFYSAKYSASALLKNVKLKAVIDEFQFIVDFADNQKNEWELISESIDFVNSFSKKHDKKIICAYDEFGDIGKFDPKGNLVKVFRSKIQHHQYASYIFAGSYESVMQNMFVTSKSPFYRMTKIIHLSYMDRETLVKHFVNEAKNYKLNISEKYFREVVNYTLGHPYYSQLAFQQLRISNILYGEIPATSQLFTAMLDAEKDYLEKVWEDISGNREYVYVLQAIAQSSENIYKRLKPKNINISRATSNLSGMGMLFKNKKQGFYISDPLLKEWILKNV